MKKLFISCPVRGRKDKDIKKYFERMHEIAEATVGEKLEVVNSFIEENPPEVLNPPIWYLGESIKKMANADYFIGVKSCFKESEESTEYTVANMYGIASILVAPHVIDFCNYGEQND